MKRLETPRLVLRPITMDDLDDIHREIYADSEVVRYYSGRTLTYEEVRAHLAGHLLSWRGETLGRLAVLRKPDSRFLGQVHLNPYVNRYARWADEPDPPYNAIEVELAFAFGRRYWGQGYACEACRAVIAHVFADLRLKRLVGNVHLDNARSVALHRRLGYRIERNLHPDHPGYVTILEHPDLGCADR